MEKIECHLTDEQLQQKLAEWKRILRLEDWDVKAKIVRGNGLNLPEKAQGNCRWVLPKKSAYLRIQDPVDWDDSIIYPQDMEGTLVHELMHLHCAPFDDFEEGSVHDTQVEQMIEAVSCALVWLKRKGETGASV